MISSMLVRACTCLAPAFDSALMVHGYPHVQNIQWGYAPPFKLWADSMNKIIIIILPKSGPAKTRPAGPAAPPLSYINLHDHAQSTGEVSYQW